MQASEIILLGILVLIPQLGPSIYNYLPKKRPIKAQILNKSLHVFSHGRENFFIGGIIVHEPCTITDESSLEFGHKIQEYLPLTLKLVKSCDHTRIYIYPFDPRTKQHPKNSFDERVQKIADLFETLFTPRKIQLMTGRELYEMLREEYGKINCVEVNESDLYDKNVYSSIFELTQIHQGDNWTQGLFLLNCILELGLEISLSFRIKMKGKCLYSAAQIRISGDKEEKMTEGIRILKKGGSLLLASPTELKLEKKELKHKLTESALQRVPYLERETSLRTFAQVIQFYVQNASKKCSFSAKDRDSHFFLENQAV